MSELIPPGLRDWLLAKVTLALSGLFGAAVSLSFIKGVTRSMAAITLGVGLVAAYFISPLVSEFFFAVFKYRLSMDAMGAVGFIVGLSALGLLPRIRDAFISRVGRTINPEGDAK